MSAMDLYQYRCNDLRKLAVKLKIKGSSKLKKGEVVELLAEIPAKELAAGGWGGVGLGLHAC